jgi:ClpP class serine protease
MCGIIDISSCQLKKNVEADMAFTERVEIIKQIQELRESKVVTYFTSDRRTFPSGFSLPALKTVLATEAQVFLYDQLRSLGKTNNLDLFLYTRGGQTDSVWPLVSIFREYALKQFAVLVPFRAHSGGTLICLGADKIIMGEAAELSPIDPTTGNQFNPLDEVDKRTRKGISVEDVISYVELAKDPTKVGLQDSDILEVFKRLSEEVHPIALGNVNRAHTQIRILADKLLKLHLSEEKEKARIERIVDQLTKSLYSHTHALNRQEAKELLGEDLVVEATEEEQRLLWQLYEEYAQVLELRKTFCADSLAVSNQPQQEHTFIGAFIETEEHSLVFRSRCRISLSSRIPKEVQVQVPAGQPMPLVPGLPVNIDVKVLSIGWEDNEKGE